MRPSHKYGAVAPSSDPDGRSSLDSHDAVLLMLLNLQSALIGVKCLSGVWQGVDVSLGLGSTQQNTI